jgi:uncharacterized protein YicC (UPF0701 family)
MLKKPFLNLKKDIIMKLFNYAMLILATASATQVNALSWDQAKKKAGSAAKKTGNIALNKTQEVAQKEAEKAAEKLLAQFKTEADKFIRARLKEGKASFNSMKNDLLAMLEKYTNAIRIPGVDTKTLFKNISSKAMKLAEDIYKEVADELDIEAKTNGIKAAAEVFATDVTNAIVGAENKATE